MARFGVKYDQLPRGYDVYTQPGTHKGKLSWLVTYFGTVISVKMNRTDAIKAAWVDASKRFKKELAATPRPGWGKLATAEAVREEWRSQKLRAKAARKSPSKTAGDVTRLAYSLNAMMK